jgi:hypothetical protein
MLRRPLVGLAALVAFLILAVPIAGADEPLPQGAEGTFELQGAHGYRLFGIIASTGTTGVLELFVSKGGEEATYIAHGEVTREHVHFDLGKLGDIDVAVQPTGQTEDVGSKCGKPTVIEGEEYVGTIDFQGEEGFTSAEASSTPLSLEPIFDLVCGGSVGVGTSSGEGIPGAQLEIASHGGPSLRLDQNHAGAPVFYEAHLSEKEGAVTVHRTVTGRLGGGALSYTPTLAAASFSAGAPFSGAATYSGTRPAHEARPGKGTWRGSLKVDFPGHRGVRLAGPDFSASIVHAKRTESHR